MNVMLATMVAALWIAGSYERPASEDTAAFFKEAPNDVLTRQVALNDQPIVRAQWRVAAPGMRDLFVNGERVTPTALPPWTAYSKRVLEETFEVTRQLRKGAVNELRIELGNGWWNLLPLKMWYHYDMTKVLAQGTPCVLATLEIEYADGSRQIVETDREWSAASGRIVKNSIYLGVRQDDRRKYEPQGPARVVEGPKGKVVSAADFPKTTVIGTWGAKSVSHLPNGKWLIDFGVNATGNLRARLHGVPVGTLVRFRSGERRYLDGTLNPMTAVAGQIKKPERGPLFAVAEQCDEWISGGAVEAVFEPRFTFHVFRYVQVEGLPYKPEPGDFEMVAWSAEVKDGAGFTCSDARLNRLHEVCRRTFRDNLQSVQSDCPGREKFGYSGDIGCTAESFRCNYAMLPFYRKVVRDFIDEAEDGLITETAPFVGIASCSVYPEGGERDQMTARGKTRAAPMGWAAGLPILLDVIVRYDGELALLAEAYPTLTKFIEKLTARYPDDDLPKCLGDWIAIEKADCQLSCFAHWHEFLTKTARFAKLLGKAEEAARFAAHAERVAEKFRRAYVKQGGLVNTGKQGEQLFALYHGLLAESDVESAYQLLKTDIVAHGNALTTGIFGTQYLFEYLSSHGDAELAGKVATHEGFPGYYYMIDRGATTLWENWDEQKCLNSNSNCHPMFGSVEQWLLRHVVGIAVCEDAVGCNRVRIEPHAVAGLTSASGWLDTPKGRISVSWKLADGQMQIEKSIPDGITIVK